MTPASPTRLPAWLTGVWRRRSIVVPSEPPDTTTQVFYVQTPSCFGDLRIPGDRPDLRHRSGLSELTPEEQGAIAQQQGFSGITELSGSVCQWHRYIDYQPPSPLRDLGFLHWADQILIEDGIDAVYREEWQRVDDGQGGFRAVVLPQTESAWQASLVSVGDWFLYTRARSLPLPSADSLTQAIATLPDALQRLALLDCEISFGMCQSGAIPWEIQFSTLPWREGQSLWEPDDLVINTLQQPVLKTDPQPYESFEPIFLSPA